MRWIWSLVIACLLAATGVRQAELTPRSDDQSTRVAASPKVLAVLVGRRDQRHAPHLHLPWVVAPEVLALDVPRVAVLVILRDAHPASPTITVSTCSARGPPIS